MHTTILLGVVSGVALGTVLGLPFGPLGAAVGAAIGKASSKWLRSLQESKKVDAIRHLGHISRSASVTIIKHIKRLTNRDGKRGLEPGKPSHEIPYCSKKQTIICKMY